MTRIHLFEIEDQKWIPSLLRDFATDFLQFGANKFDMYKGAIPIIEKGMSIAGSEKINDKASGGGGGWPKILEHLKVKHPNIKVTLSDFYPNIKAFEYIKNQEEAIDYTKEPIDVLSGKIDNSALQTMFLSFHHFKPNDAKQILQNTVDNNATLLILESQDRSPISLISMLFSPISLFIMTPMIKPFSLLRILFTYFIPILPFFVLWDGVVSSLRTYTDDDLKELISEVEGSNNYEWEIGETKSGPITNHYLLAYPKK